MSSRHIVSLTNKLLSDIFEDIIYDNNISEEIKFKMIFDFDYSYNRLLLHIVDYFKSNEYDKYNNLYEDITSLRENSIMLQFPDEYKIEYNTEPGIVLIINNNEKIIYTLYGPTDKFNMVYDLQKFIIPYDFTENKVL